MMVVVTIVIITFPWPYPPADLVTIRTRFGSTLSAEKSKPLPYRRLD
jgi:hypothetical protein